MTYLFFAFALLVSYELIRALRLTSSFVDSLDNHLQHRHYMHRGGDDFRPGMHIIKIEREKAYGSGNFLLCRRTALSSTFRILELVPMHLCRINRSGPIVLEMYLGKKDKWLEFFFLDGGPVEYSVEYMGNRHNADIEPDVTVPRYWWFMLRLRTALERVA